LIEKLHTFIENGDVLSIKKLMEDENLIIKDGKLIANDMEAIKDKEKYWDQIQLIKKIALNSIYGALTNAGSLFFDQRLGQSCTLSGRCTTRHMGSKINEYIMGTYDLGTSCVAGDTDSIYFTVANPDDYDKESFVKFSDKIASDVNATFSDYFNATFNVPLQNTKVIKCGREICATAALFIKKKRYTALVYDEKGYRYDTKGKEGKLKIMGLDIKRADCPAWVQQKLEDTIFQLLAKEYSEAEILEYIRAWREEFASFDPWKMGTPKRVNKLTYYTGVFRNKTKGITVPGHVRASINWNDMLNFQNDRNSMTIMDGQKVIVCKLLKNKFNIDSIAYPIDQHFLPDWFKVMPFDTNLMVTTAVDQRIENIFGMLDWNLEQSKETETFRENFSWE
jgi:DNA polymerase elongation subunit (family B)